MKDVLKSLGFLHVIAMFKAPGTQNSDTVLPAFIFLERKEY
jgi:hypothetical protein